MTTPRKAPAKKAPAKKAAAPKVAPSTEAEASEDDEQTLLDKAAAALAEVGLGLSDVLAELMPNEAKEDELVRKPLRPSLTNIKKAPVFVVMLEWDTAFSTEIDRPIDRDSQPFDDIDKALDYFNIQTKWAKTDVKEFGTGSHLVVLFKDTTDFADRQYEVISGDPAWTELVQERIDADDIDFLFSGKKKPSADAKPSAKKGVPKANVKKRAPSAAAKKVQTDDDAPNERVADLNARLKESRARRAASKAEADEAPAKNTNPVKKSAPRRRKAASAPEPEEVMALMPMGFIGVSRNSARRRVRSAN